MDASEAVARVLQENGYTLDGDYAPGGAELLFYADRTMLYVQRAGAARFAASGTGSLVQLGLDVAPGKPAGLMDGKRNRKLLAELEQAITAAVGSA